MIPTRVSIVVPVYDNAASLPALYARLRDTAGAAGDEFEFVFVDDGSQDASPDVLRDLSSADPRVRVVELSRNFGSNGAILAGLAHASGAVAVVLAADLQDPPELVPQLLERWRAGSEIVLAARRSRSDPVVSRLFAQAFNRLFRRFVFPDFPKQGFDFVLLDRRVIEILVRQAERNSHLFGQVMWVGFRRAVILYDRVERPVGTSRWTTSKKIKYFIDAFTAFSYLPLRVSSVGGMLLACVGLLYAVALLAMWLFAGVRVDGWRSLLVVVLIAAGAQLFVLGILGEYVWRILDDTRRRPPFIVARTTNVPSDVANARRPDRSE